MSEFTPITTQEQFDAAIGERLKRERETLTRKYGDYDDLKVKVSEYETQIGELSKNIKDSAAKYADYDKTLENLKSQIKEHETSSVKMRIAHEIGIPYELANRLNGDDESAIRSDAEKLFAVIGKKNNYVPPLKSTEPSDTNPKTAALKRLTNELSKGDNI